MENEQTAIILINGYREERVLIEKTVGTDEQGRPIVELQVQNGFDGMTGQPTYMTVVHCGFDPASGRPMYEEKDAQFAIPQQASVDNMSAGGQADMGAPVAGDNSTSNETGNNSSSDTVLDAASGQAPFGNQVNSFGTDVFGKAMTNSTAEAESGQENAYGQNQAYGNAYNQADAYGQNQAYGKDAYGQANAYGQNQAYGNNAYGQNQAYGNAYNQADAYGQNQAYGNNAYSQNQAYGSNAYGQANAYNQADAYGQNQSYGNNAYGQNQAYGNAYNQADAYGQNQAYGNNAYGQNQAYGNAYNQADAYGQNQAYYGNDYNQAGGKSNKRSFKAGKKGLVAILIAVVVLLVCGLGVFGAIKSGLFLSPRYKIALAAAKTAQESELLNTMSEITKVAQGDEFTTDMSCNVNAGGTRVNASATVAQDASSGKMGVNGKIEVGGVLDQSFEAYYDDKKLQVAVPDLYDDVIEYNYKEKNRGWLADIIESETDGNIQDVNNILSSVNDMYKNSGKYRKEVEKQMKDAYSEVEVNKIDKKSFEVNGKDHKCAGYEVVITPSNVRDFMRAYTSATDNAYGKSMDSLFKSVSNLTGEDLDYKDITSDMSDEIGDFDEVVLEFYLYKGMLAAIETEVDGAEVSIQFLGGDTRISEIEIIADAGSNKEKATVEIKNKNGKEEGELKVEGMTICGYSYNSENGKLAINAAGMDVLSGTISVDKGKRVKMGISGEYDGTSLDYEITIAKGAKINEIKGDTFDIGSADEGDMEDLVKDIMSNIGGLAGLGDLDDVFSYRAPSFDLDDFDF